MRRIGLCLTTLFMLVTLSFGAPPSVSLPSEIEVSAGRIVQLDPKPKDVTKAIWSVKYGVDADGKLIKVNSVDLVPVCEGNQAFFASKISGKYVVSLTVWNTDGIAQVETTLVVMNGEANPSPEPGPKPKPGPDPAPNKVSKVYIAVLRDPANVSPELAGVLADTQFWKDLTIGGSDWDFFTFDSKDAEKNGYLTQAKKVAGNENELKVPTIVILNLDEPKGKVLKVEKMPTSKDEIKKLVESIRK